VDDPAERPAIPAWLEAPDIRGRLGARDCEHALDGLQDAADAPESQRRCDEPDDFPVVRARESADDLNRIGGGVGIVEVGVEAIENGLQTLGVKLARQCRYYSVMARTVLKVAAGFALLVAIAVAGAYIYLRRSLPSVDGTVAVNGIHGSVEIIRDGDAIPHVFASNKADALFGLGYVHAQDRLWQMEFQRRIGFGRLSEIFGAATVPQDRFLRTVGFGRAARVAWNRAPAWAKEQVDAYVAGVNAFIATHHGSQLPPEFSLLRFEPEPWSGADVVVWVKMMAWDLSANYSFELLRDDLVRAVGEDRMQQLMPPYPVNGLSIVDTGQGWSNESTGSGGSIPHSTDTTRSAGRTRAANPTYATFSAADAWTRALSQGDPVVADILLGGSRTEALGSNNWVVDGTLTASGRPILANDPHLSAKTPSTWYLAHVVGGDFEVIGATLPGAPAVAIGRNRFIAWGETNVAADVEDLFRERLDATGTSAEFRGAREPITVIPETIVVKGAPAIQVNVRVTRHGPLVSDAINAIDAASPKTPKPPPHEPLALRWTALDDDDTTLQAFLELNDARNWDQFTGALRQFVVPSQNFVYGDIEGHIGYYAPGHIPVRASGDGSRPTDGWTGTTEWTGWVPFAELPHAFDPPNHFIVTANNRPEPPGYPYLLGLEWIEPYRAQRIVDMLAGRSNLTPEDFAKMQADTLSLHAKALLPVLLPHARPDNARDQEALDVLARWDGHASAEGVAPAIFSAWFHALTPAIVGDELGKLATDNYASRYTYITRFLVQTLSANDRGWCDDIRTERRETCDDAVTLALHEAISTLSERLGANISRWRWDGVHRAMFPHQGLDSVGVLRPLLSRSVPNGGDWSTVDVGAVAADQAYEQHAVPGYRQIIDLSPANDSRFLNDVGESGHFLSKHYDDFLPEWRAVREKKMRMDRADIELGAIGHLSLTPTGR
jgi:penicillin amidase